MRWVRTGLLIAWFVLIGSLFWDPLTPLLTAPDNLASPFHVHGPPVVVQGKEFPVEAYPMGNRIFWTMALPLVPIFLIVFGHEAWRRVCPLSHFSQIPHMLGWQRKIKVLNRRSGRVDRVLALLPEAWLRRNHYYFQFAFLAAGVCGRILFDNADRRALVGVFAFMLLFALLIGLLYGGKTWCNYFCPIAVIQDIYTGPGGLFDSKAHLAATPVNQSMCRAPDPNGDRSICVGCTTNCPDIDVENSYWKTLESDQKRLMYYGFFGLVFAFYTYYYVYSGGWDYYMTGAWTHEPEQMSKLFGPGFYIGGVAIPIPKIIAAPLYFAVCIAIGYWLWLWIERGYARLARLHGKALSKARLRHQMLTVCAFFTFNLFYIFAGRPNILLMPGWAVKLIDAIFVLVSVAWMIRSLRRDAELYNRERVARSLRDQLVRMGFRSEDVLEGRAIDQLSADEVYVLAKSLSNFTVAQKRDAYRAILAEALESGHTKSSESLELLKDLRTQLGLTEADHHAITEVLGVQDPGLLDPEAGRSVEDQVRRENYRAFLVHLAEQGLAAGRTPAAYLASPQALEAMAPVRILYRISDEEHARLVGEIAHDERRFAATAENVLEKIYKLEASRFSLASDTRPEALLGRHALLLRQKALIRDMAFILGSIEEVGVARSLAQSAYVLLGQETERRINQSIAGLPAEIREAFREMTSDPVQWSYLDVIEASKPADDVFRELAADHDPEVAVLAISGLARTHGASASALAAELEARNEALSPLAEEALAAVRASAHSDTIAVMAELLAVDVFTALDLGALAHIARQSVHKTFRAGDQICRFGENSDTMYVLVRGETEVWVEGERGRVVIRHSKAGAVFGELGVITGQPRSTSIEVVSPTAEVIAIPRDVIEDLVSSDAQAARAILMVVSSYLQTPPSAPAAPQTAAVAEQPLAAE